MIVARSNWQLRRAIDSARQDAISQPIHDIVRERPRVAFVPTMGALHEGHISLLRRAAEDDSPIRVASVFVNPTQFAKGEDFSEYPRTEESDLELLDAAGVDVAYLPSVDDIYPPDFGSRITADRKLTDCLCGTSRGAEHFDGVVTVVARLFGLVQPDTAWFGEKDWQQLQIIRRMAADIHPGVEVMRGATVRATDGVALSSRNAYLTQEARDTARAVPDALAAARAAFVSSGDVETALNAGIDLLEAAGLEVDYFELRSAQTLEPVLKLGNDDPELPNHARLFVAARLEGVRLIDNDALRTNSNIEASLALTS